MPDPSSRKNLCIVLGVTMAVIAAIYTPQPLLNVLKDEFAVSKAMASLLITLTLVPLGFAPILYGLLLQSISARRLMGAGILLLAMTELAVFFRPSFGLFLALRLMQGLLIPAILTSLMTFLSGDSSREEVQKTMAYYVAATTVGGFLGRFVSGAVSSRFGWRYSFLLLFFVLMCAWGAHFRLRCRGLRPKFVRPRLKSLAETLARPGFLRVYLTIFCCFFVFASLLNFLPFRLAEIRDNPSEFEIASIYLGYLMGIAVAVFSNRIAGFVGSTFKGLLLGLGLHLAATLAFLSPHPAVMYGGMFVFCSGFFLTHSLAPGLLNRDAGQEAGVVNGLYISFYYAGGALGSFAPGLVYQEYGWTAFIGLLSLMLITAVILVPRNFARARPKKIKGRGEPPDPDLY